MKLINSHGRIFLWNGSMGPSKRKLVSWEKVCMPRVVGGLNILNLYNWNKATVAKQLWVIASKVVNLWIKQVHIYYIKGEPLETCNIPRNAIWVIRKIFESRRTIMQAAELQGNLHTRLKMLTIGARFSIKKLYTTQFHKSQKFHERLLLYKQASTLDTSSYYGQHYSSGMFFKDAMEMHDHLFFECLIKRNLWCRILACLGFIRTIVGWQQEVDCIISQATKRSQGATYVVPLQW